MFPWLVVTGEHDRGSVLPQDIATKLGITEFRANSYASALTEVPELDGESGMERQMRQLLHICLTRWLRVMLTRKDLSIPLN